MTPGIDQSGDDMGNQQDTDNAKRPIYPVGLFALSVSLAYTLGVYEVSP